MNHPRSEALGLKYVSTNGSDHPGFDQEEVEAKLGSERSSKFMAKLVSDPAYSASVFCVNHRKYAPGHQFAGYEAHCVYADDLERFLGESE